MARRSALRRWRPSAVAVVTTAGLVGALGSEDAVDRTARAGRLRPLLVELTGFPAWATTRLPSDLEWALAAKVATLLLTVALLARVVAAAQSRVAAFVGGWGALVLSGALAGLVFLQVGAVVPAATGAAGPPGGVRAGSPAAVVLALNEGALFGLYTGWLVGVAVALAAPAPSAVGAGSGARPPGSTARRSRRTRAGATADGTAGARSPVPGVQGTPGTPGTSGAPVAPPRAPSPPRAASPPRVGTPSPAATPAPAGTPGSAAAPGSVATRGSASPAPWAPPSPPGVGTPPPVWPPRPRIGTVLPNPAWMAAGLHQQSLPQEPVDRSDADADVNTDADATSTSVTRR